MLEKWKHMSGVFTFLSFFICRRRTSGRETALLAAEGAEHYGHCSDAAMTADVSDLQGLCAQPHNRYKISKTRAWMEPSLLLPLSMCSPLCQGQRPGSHAVSMFSLVIWLKISSALKKNKKRKKKELKNHLDWKNIDHMNVRPTKRGDQAYSLQLYYVLRLV